MDRKIQAYGSYYEDFFNSLDSGSRQKVLYGMLLLKTIDRLPSKFVKYIGSGVYELRIEWQGNIFRIFFCFDASNLVILFNGFKKKSQDTPRAEIEKAIRLKNEYYARKEDENV